MATKKTPAKKATKPTAPAEPKRAELTAAVVEMSTLLQPDEDVAKLKKMGPAKLKEEILSGAELLQAGDELSQETIDIIKTLDGTVPDGIKIAGTEETAEPNEPADEEAPEVVEEKTEKPAPKKAAKPAPKKAKKKSEKKVESAEKKEGYTRSHALLDALKAVGSGGRDEVVQHSDGLFVKAGGKTNTNVANYMFGYVMPSLIILGHVKKEGKNFIWIK